MKPVPERITRRSFVKKSALATAFAPVLTGSILSVKPKGNQQGLKVHIFSKHLQFLGYDEMAKMAKEIGFDGVDLTVRPNGHVLPENVEKDLPKAVNAVRKAGLLSEMMTTAVSSADNELDRRVLTTASKMGIKRYRMNWLRYADDKTIPESLVDYQKQIISLGELNKQLGLIGCYQNHSGTLVGSSIFELYELIKLSDPDFLGSQYDIRHAKVEGGESWENGLRLIAPRIRTIAIKDFYWGKEGGKWRAINVPMGEGMLDFNKYFGLLKKYKINVPVSLHLEYDLGGAQHGDREISVKPEVVYAAMKKDLEFVHREWAKA